jgi:hypothetical protein
MRVAQGDVLMNRKAGLGLAALGCVAAGVGIVVLSGGIATAPPAAPQQPASAPPESAVAAAASPGRPEQPRHPAEGPAPTAEAKKMVITGIVTGASVEAATFYAEQQGRRAESPEYHLDLRWQGRDVRCCFTSKVGIDRLDDGTEVTVAGTSAGTLDGWLVLKDCQLLNPSVD